MMDSLSYRNVLAKKTTGDKSGVDGSVDQTHATAAIAAVLKATVVFDFIISTILLRL
ncbi:MAG: hypothetical protein WA364_29925 [Candidatus Nitrosopolaris sp.]